MPEDIRLSINDSTLHIRIKAWRTDQIEDYEVKNLPIAVVAMIHYIQKRFGEPEEING